MSKPWANATALMPQIKRIHASHAAGAGEADRLIAHFCDQALRAAQRLGEIASRQIYEYFMCIRVVELMLLSAGLPWQERVRLIDTFAELPWLRFVEGVFSPEHAIDSHLWAKFIVAQGLAAGRSVLEMGAGTGLISLYLLLHGHADQASVVDVNPAAVENLKLNRKLFGVEAARMPIFQSDLFEQVPPAHFDLLLWAMPWIYVGIPKGIQILVGTQNAVTQQWLRSIIDVRFSNVRRFITQAKSRLKPGGSVLLISPYCCRNAVIKTHARLEGLTYHRDLVAADVDVVPDLGMVLNLYQIRLSAT